MRILITGGKGQLGLALTRALSAHDLRAPGHDDLDITDGAAVTAALREFAPHVLIHTAAWTNTTAAETDPAAALAVNGGGTRNVARACAAAGIPIAHVSTNEVFDGAKGGPYDEDDTPNPINEYGRTKLAGEQSVREETNAFYIIRTSWVYGPGRVSFPEKIIEHAQKDGVVRGVTDEIATPTWTDDLAAAIGRLIETREYGVFHLAGSGDGCSRLEWAQEVLRLAGIDVPTESAVQADFNLPFRKPVNSTLANNHAAALGITLRPWRDALADHMRTPQVAELIAAGASR
jgi:dTDP-4-dehydrorhamnose reductase